jgi:hypothetical protein
MSSKPQEKGISYAFKQQIMKAWQPVPTLTSTIILFFVLSLFFLIMGIVLISFTEAVAEHYQRYDVLCKGEYNNHIIINYETSALSTLR